jgi:hypothetical protein
MQPVCLVVYQNDPGTAQHLLAGLSRYFGSVKLASHYEEVRPTIVRSHADVLILDMEKSKPGEIGRLHQEFPFLHIVGTHRLADDELWAKVLNEGASDLCGPREEEVVRSILHQCAMQAAA